MKTVTMDRDFDYRPVRSQVIAYRAGQTYQRVPEAAARAILAAGAGRIVDGNEDQRMASTSAVTEGEPS